MVWGEREISIHCSGPMIQKQSIMVIKPFTYRLDDKFQGFMHFNFKAVKF